MILTNVKQVPEGLPRFLVIKQQLDSLFLCVYGCLQSPRCILVCIIALEEATIAWDYFISRVASDADKAIGCVQDWIIGFSIML